MPLCNCCYTEFGQILWALEGLSWPPKIAPFHKIMLPHWYRSLYFNVYGHGMGSLKLGGAGVPPLETGDRLTLYKQVHPHMVYHFECNHCCSSSTSARTEICRKAGFLASRLQRSPRVTETDMDRLGTYPSIHPSIHPSMYLLAKCQHDANNNAIDHAKWSLLLPINVT